MIKLIIMKKDNIEILIQKYLNGETTPEEEKKLAVEVSRDDAPQEWKIIAEMLGELTVDEALYDKMMAERNKKPRIIKFWPWVAAACVAVLLIVFLAPPKEEVRQVAKIEDIRMEQSEPIIPEDTKPVQEVLVAGGKIEPTPVAKSKDIVVKKNITTNQVAKVENVEKEPLLAEATFEPAKEAEDIFDVTLADVRRATLEKMMSCNMDCMNENIKYRGNRLAALINEQ